MNIRERVLAERQEQNTLGKAKGEDDREAIIVSRHAGAIEFLREEMPEVFGEAPVVEVASREDVIGRIVGGNLPLELAASAYLVFLVLFAGDPPRGKELSPGEMREVGAYVAPFQVSAGLGSVCIFCHVRGWDGWHCTSCGAC